MSPNLGTDKNMLKTSSLWLLLLFSGPTFALQTAASDMAQSEQATVSNKFSVACANCHREIVPFLERPIDDARKQRRLIRDPQRRWKLLGGYTFAVLDAASEAEVRAYGRKVGEIQRIYTISLPGEPIRYFLPAQGVNPHDVLAR